METPVSKEPRFCFVLFFCCCCHEAQGDRHWLCSVCHRARAQAKGQGQMAWKGRSGWARRKMPWYAGMNDTDRMCFSSLAVKTSPAQFSFLWSQWVMHSDILQSFVYYRILFANDRESLCLQQKLCGEYCYIYIHNFFFFFKDNSEGKK